MSTQKSDEPKGTEVPGAKDDKDAKDWSEQLKKFAYAAVGAVNLSQDDVKSFVKRLVEKGEIAKKDGEKILKQFADKVQQTVKRDAKTVAEKAEGAVGTVADKAKEVGLNQEKLAERINNSLERMLHTMNIATRKDVEELGKQLDDLDKKVVQLIESATGRARKPVAQPTGTGA